MINHDIKPIEPERRKWGSLAFISLWSVVAFNMSNFQLGSSLLSVGLNWWQSVVATLLGHIFAAVLIIIVSFPGLYYHISFPLSQRMTWGFNGAIFVVMNRILLSVIWFGVQSWQGGLMTYVCLRSWFPSIDNLPPTFSPSTGMNLAQFVGFIVFFVLQLPFLLVSPAHLRYLAYVSTVVGLIVQLVLVIWACSTMEAFGDILNNTHNVGGGQLGWSFVFGITVTMSSITSGTLSVCDYTRFAKRPRSGILPQFAGFLPAWLSNVFGILTVAGTQKRFGAELWSVVQLLMAIQDQNPTTATRCAVWFAGFSFLINQLALNIIGNSFSGGTDMASLLPKYINIRRGQYLTAILGLVINPWYLVSGALVFLSVMSAYTVFLQPFLGTVAASYFVLYKQRIKVSDLYKLSGNIYWYNHGVNWRAIVSWAVGVAPHLPGFLHTVNPTIKVGTGAEHMYLLTAISSFAISFTMTVILGYMFPVRSQQEFVNSVSRQEAIQLKEDFINSSDIMRGVEVPLPGEKSSRISEIEKDSEKM
ncbi:uncharacterized protein A1O9_12207 [Exophiala aquamarina CBS 119918]|uniref:NCS1 family nucleobase:cation symporter-1 n=1 Tax=Exophiala aquamarina CBS 119918 TaxID=1182545 RepID=A0A072NVI2_9EURO|nr:uncharacterized protein A1O9_12207 [Exophiala aquamarina CBS 119918]KEF51869.1 hypothetical protein A1O9_12207 [Exophiala aquamarina CBS 119918]